MFKPKTGVAIIGMAILSGLFVGAPADQKPASACINCTGVTTSLTKHMVRIVLNGTVVTKPQFHAYLVAAQNGGLPAPTWRGCFDEDIQYQVVQHYLIGSKLMFRTHIGAHWCWGPGDHINGYPTPPPHIEYTSNNCCYIHQDGPPDVLAFWYHLPGRNIDSGYKVQVHFKLKQDAPYLPLPLQNDVLMWLEMHGNGTDAYNAGGGKVIG